MKKISFVVDKKIVYVNHKFTNNKNIYLKITKDNNLLITSPQYITDEKIIKIFTNKIEKFLKYINQESNNILYSLQEKFVFYNGKKLTIEFLTGFLESAIKIKGNKFYIMSQGGSNVECIKILKNYFKKEMIKYVNQYQPIFEKKMHVPQHQIKVFYKFSNWAANNINLQCISYSSRLMHFSSKVRNYVIVHELTHYFERNHSKSFYNIIAKYYLDYKNCEKQLSKKIHIANI